LRVPNNHTPGVAVKDRVSAAHHVRSVNAINVPERPHVPLDSPRRSLDSSGRSLMLSQRVQELMTLA
jgi:hypothetical protein